MIFFNHDCVRCDAERTPLSVTPGFGVLPGNSCFVLFTFSNVEHLTRNKIPWWTTGVPLPIMPGPPRKPPKKNSERTRWVPWDCYKYWVRESDRHPMVQSEPDEIVNGTHAFWARLRQNCSPSPDASEFSWFSSRPATPDTMAPGPPSQHPVYSYPPPPPPPYHPPQALTPSVRQPAPHPCLSQFPPPANNPPPPPSSGSSQGQQGECGYPYSLC